MGKVGRPIVLGKRLTRDLFDLDEGSSVPIWVQIKNRLVYLITSGYFVPNDKLPTVRGLAAELGVNYNTIGKVYQSLEESGYVVSVHRQGTFVCAVDEAIHDDVSAEADRLIFENIDSCRALGLTLDDVENRFAACMETVRQHEEDKRREYGTSYVEEPDNGAGTAGARIIQLADAADHRRRSAGNGA